MFTDLVTASKLLPPVLGLMASLFTYLLVARLYPSGPAAFLASVLSSWYVWQYDDLATGSPRAFLLPLTAMLLYALVAGWRWWLVVGVVALEAVLYPSAAALGVVLVAARLVEAKGWRLSYRAGPGRVGDDGRLRARTLVLLAPTAFGASEFGPTVSAQAARQLSGVRSERPQRLLQP